MKYSQNDEEEHILNYFSGKPAGRFIDIGAFHAEKFSNTRALFLAGWEGVLVEPAPENYRGIQEHYKDEPRIKVLNIAVGEVNGEIDFYDCGGDAISTSDEAHMKKWERVGVKYTKIKVPQVSVVDFMNEYCKDVDFISIDTEATNMALFINIPDFVWGQIKLVVIEHDNRQDEIEKKLKKFGFTTRYMNAENILLGK